MIKVFLWPLAIALFALILVGVFARKNGAVSTAIKNINKDEQYHFWQFWIALVVVFELLFVMISLKQDEIVRSTFLFLGGMIVIFGVFLIAAVKFAIDFFIAIAPTAAEVGEQLSEEQRQAVFRHGMRYFRKFQRW